MKLHFKYSILLSVIVIFIYTGLQAQSTAEYTLQQLIDSAVNRSHLVAIKDWQIKEKTNKLKEDAIKRYPSVVLGGSFQYNFSLGELNIPAGSIGVFPIAAGEQLLPQQNTNLRVGQHENYSVDVSLYQPILQQAKIKTGLDIDKVDIAVSEREQLKVKRELTLAVQKLYYGILISEKQKEEAVARLALANAKLVETENALIAGKTSRPNLAGLRAIVAEEEQNVLKLDITVQDYKRDLATIANLDEARLSKLQTPDTTMWDTVVTESVDRYIDKSSTNTELQIMQLNREKALLAIKAAKQSNLPDVGFVAGYYYQKGNPILPTSSPYIGINLKWNLQDLFSNHQVTRQRQSQLKQAEHALAYQQQQLYTDINKTYRKVSQTRALVQAARKARNYRCEELKVQQDRQVAGLNVTTEILEVKANLSKSESDLYSAQLSYLLAKAELENLTGKSQ
jgi:outer membrane protein